MAPVTFRTSAAAAALLAVLAAPVAADEASPPGAGPADEPAPGPGEEIVITATRGPRPGRDVPAAATVLPRAELERSPSKTVDELLWTVPSFGLLRRSSSVVADPSAQGVNLRGIGPSGVSRSLVLVDGIPANDPFGGWVYWRAIPRIGVERVEVVPGGGSALYGNYALGGVTQLFSRAPTPLSVELTAEGGSFDTSHLALRAADRRGPIGAVVEGEVLRSDGYAVVAPEARGVIDGRAFSSHEALSARVEAAATRELSLTFRGGWLHEDQNGGTRYTTAGVERLEYAAAARWAPEGAGALEASVFGHRNVFDQQRARVAAGRAAETLAASQEVPADDLGASVLWRSAPVALAGKHALAAGADGRRISAETREDLFPPAPVPDTAVVRRVAGGTQWLYGAFVQDVWDVSDAVAVDAALRLDRWDDRDGRRVERDASGATTTREFAARSEAQLSPKVGLRVRPLGWLAVRGGAYRAFRAPTLNELYRPFQVGTVRTESNEDLGPETLRGGEAGLDVGVRGGLSARVTGFWNELQDPVVNVTIAPGSRQRQNLGRARIRGAEAELGWRFLRAFTLTAAYTLVDSEVRSAPGQPQLVGKRLPLDPVHRASAALAYDHPRLLSAVVQLRFAGPQWEDDLNTSRLGGAALVDLALTPRLSRDVELRLAVENVFDRTYLVGRAGVDTIGQPRFFHGGIRARFGR